MKKVISSLQNPLIKSLVTLGEKSRERRKQDRFVIEGEREITMAVQSGHTLEILIYCPDIYPDANFLQFKQEVPDTCEIIEVSRDVFNRLVYRKDNGGLVACAIPGKTMLPDLVLPEKPLLLVLESVEKPGNLGAILRTADAAGISAIVICDPKTDLYNPNTIRASLGTLFSNQVAIASVIETIQWLKEKKIRSFATALPGKRSYHEVDFTGP